MGDSDEENETLEDSVNLTGFLFGNIDESGQLESDVFDVDTLKQLSSLGKLGFQSILKEIVGLEKKHEDSDSDCDYSDINLKHEFDDLTNIQNEHNEKLIPAVDYSDINELADEEIENDSGDIRRDNIQSNDKRLMPPPPPLPLKQENVDVDKSISDDSETKRKLETPLAAMLPSKYADIDVTDLFPDFRYGQVLRFSRVFGPGKPSSLPNIWRNVKKRRKRRKQKEYSAIHESDSSADDEKPKNKGWFFDYAPTPPLKQCASDDEDIFLKPIEASSVDAKKDSLAKDDTGPKVADWRFGPAQVWYDILEVPDTGEGFNYGFKLGEKQNSEEEIHSSYEDSFPDDAFLMVTQLHWEDDIVWDGNDIKHKKT